MESSRSPDVNVNPYTRNVPAIVAASSEASPET